VGPVRGPSARGSARIGCGIQFIPLHEGLATMRVEFYGLTFERRRVVLPLVAVRCSDLEHRIFKSLQNIPGIEADNESDEHRLHLADARGWKASLQAVARF